jgi:phospholipid transport system substrate-binding protein
MRTTQLIVSLVFVVHSWPAAAEIGPREVVEQANNRIHKLVSQNAREGTPQAAERDRQLKAVVTELLDLDFMAQDALGRTWDERTPAERQEYLSLMRQLVERSYLRQARSRVQYTMTVRDVTIDQASGRAEVETVLVVTTHGRREEVEVEYDMALREGRWRVIDVQTDGASTVRNYRAQFRRIIQQDGFGELLARLRSRLEAGESDI